MKEASAEEELTR